MATPLGLGWRLRLGCGLAVLPAAAASALEVPPVGREASPATGSAARGPGLNPYVGICLGDCFECHSLLEALPRWPRLSAASSHTEPARVSIEEVQAFVTAPEVCDVRSLYPVSLDREVWSLAALVGGASQLRYPGARAQVRLVTERCSAMAALAADALAEARRSAAVCAEGAPGDGGARCRAEAARRGSAAFAGRWAAVAGWHPPSDAAQTRGGVDARRGAAELTHVVDFRGSGNETGDLAEAFSARAAATLRRWAAAPAADAEVGALAELPLGQSAGAALLGLSMELSRAARLLVEHARTIWGLRDLMVEVSSVYPGLREDLPVFRVHHGLYGRHWDVLEWLLHGLAGSSGTSHEEAAATEAPLRMVELGVACGPIGVHLLPRFPSLRYAGADPTVPEEVAAAYSLYSDRATVFANTSEELHAMLDPAEPLDLVFIDGPHTYKNVRNDLELWAPRVRPGGIIAGHDFTCAHPPLLWAVTEFRMDSRGADINLAIDGVWWWRVE